jgi:hypothetical protein
MKAKPMERSFLYIDAEDYAKEVSQRIFYADDEQSELVDLFERLILKANNAGLNGIVIDWVDVVKRDGRWRVTIGVDDDY